ncbi:single-stranded DNA-binding protein [Halosquirtibacter laminarini]|uniref:Single-stranded DNA-binding protein n=1 Tax=Halosquirtibacter laminarini TaxID=3374600 RepID=A0AC61NGH9_9BACT|nr:single-stranded DNA-binding protein [Prolixibacteraceae bacterium]
MSVNKVILIGYVGNNPETHYFDKENCVSRFPFATNESHLNKSNEKVTQTEWHRIACWGKQAILADKHIKKGMHLYIEGKLKSRTIEKKDTPPMRITEIIAYQIQILDKKESD